MPTAAHVIYIPVMLMIGVVIGYILGSRAARDAFAAEQARKVLRHQAEEEFAARAAAASQAASAQSEDAEEATPFTQRGVERRAPSVGRTRSYR